MIVAAAFAGAGFALGVYVLVRALVPSRPGLGTRVRTVDAMRQADRPAVALPGVQRDGPPTWKERLGARVAAFYAAQGWEQRTVRADLALLGRAWDTFLATKVLLGVAGVVFAPFLFAGLNVLGVGMPATTPLWLALLFGVVAFLLPDAEVRRDGAARRRDFRRVVGSYLDLVAMNLAGGRGVPEALVVASRVGDGWELRRIRQTLSHARITGVSQWEALGQLGEELAVEELKDLASALALVADDGAKIRASLASRAETMRHRELTEIEGRAGERSQTMLVAQMLLCVGFLLFLTFPAAMRVFEM